MLILHQLCKLNADGSTRVATKDEASELSELFPNVMPKACGNCNVRSTSLWRPGPPCMPVMCNACWVRERRKNNCFYCFVCGEEHGSMVTQGAWT